MRLVRLSAHTVQWLHRSLPCCISLSFLSTLCRLPLFPMRLSLGPSLPHHTSTQPSSLPINLPTPPSSIYLFSFSIHPSSSPSLSLLSFTSHCNPPLPQPPHPTPTSSSPSEAIEWAAQGKSVEAAGFSPNGLIC